MKIKQQIFVVIVVFAAAVLCSCIPIIGPGYKGEIYDRWATSNETFKVRITAYREAGPIFMPGAFIVYETAPADSDSWKTLLERHADDPVPAYVHKFQFVTENAAYFSLQSVFLATTDGGKTWTYWDPRLPEYEGLTWYIEHPAVEPDGTGNAILERYDKDFGPYVVVEIQTEDYGKTWKLIPDTMRRVSTYEK